MAGRAVEGKGRRADMGLSGAGRRLWQRPRPFLRGVLAGVALVFVMQFLINRTTVADWVVSPLLLRDSSGTADAIVALGAGVTADCVPNQNAVRRVLLAARLWRAKRAPVVFFTGGSPVHGCSVAEAMARLAMEIGVPEWSVRVETTSQSTHENGEHAAPLLRALGAHRLLLVTDRLHMRRAEGVFAREGFEIARAAVPVYEGHLDNVSMLRAGLREFVALAYYRMRGWIGSNGPSAAAAESGPGAAARLARGEAGRGGSRSNIVNAYLVTPEGQQ